MRSAGPRTRPTVHRLLRLALFADLYGLAAGAASGWTQMAEDLVKLPLLVFVTGAVSGLAWYLFSLSFGCRARFWDVQRIALDTFGDLAALLAGLAPVVLVTALSIVPPRDYTHLGEYPLFLELNVLAIALSGGLALLRHGRRLRQELGLSRRRAAALTSVWLLVALFVGGQAAWYLRPFYGIPFEHLPHFCLGSTPDFRGATSFYEAVADTFRAVLAP